MGASEEVKPTSLDCPLVEDCQLGHGHKLKLRAHFKQTFLKLFRSILTRSYQASTINFFMFLITIQHSWKDIFLPALQPSPPGQWWCSRPYWRAETPASSR